MFGCLFFFYQFFIINLMKRCQFTYKCLSLMRYIMLFEYSSKIECDVCINNPLGVINSQLLKCYAEYDPRARELIFNVKLWTKRRNITSAMDGTFSSYSWVLLCIFYLQNTSPPVLPVLQSNPDESPINDTHARFVYHVLFFIVNVSLF